MPDAAPSHPSLPDWITNLPLRIGLGTLGIGSAKDRPAESDAIALLHFAFSSGIRLVDTADVYCHNKDDLHYAERLIAEAIASWPGSKADASGIRVATKVGMIRHAKGYRPAGQPKQLRAAAEGSLQALGGESLFLLQLHVRDPDVPWEEQLGLLAELQKEGKVQHLGLCNVSPADVRIAKDYFTVASVQNELNLKQTKSAQSGMLSLCESEGIPLFAYRPLGGPRQFKQFDDCDILTPLGQRFGASPQEVAIASLLNLSPNVVPLVGPSRPATLKSCTRAAKIQLAPGDRLAISLRYPLHQDLATASRIHQANQSSQPLQATVQENQGPSSQPEVVLLMGIQGAGKSDLVKDYLQAGYARLNRDQLGGTLNDLVPRLLQLLGSGRNRVVLDNTYPTIASRAPIIQAATFYGVPVRCRHLQTSYADATINVCLRMVQKYGLPLGPEEMKAHRKTDPNLPPPAALERFIATLQRPSLAEGFAAVDLIPFERRINPRHQQKAILLDADGTLRLTHSGMPFPKYEDDIKIMPRRSQVLTDHVDKGYQLFIVSNQSGIAAGDLSHQQAQICFYKTVQMLGVPVTEIAYCPHPHKPVGCFCRKPGPGLGVYLMEKYGLARDSLIMVGDRSTDAEFAAGLGIEYVDESDFF